MHSTLPPAFLVTIPGACLNYTAQRFDCLRFVQVAIVAGTTFIFVEILAACLFLATCDANNIGYYPSSGMVTLFYACDTVFWCYTSCRCHVLSCKQNRITRYILSSALQICNMPLIQLYGTMPAQGKVSRAMWVCTVKSLNTKHKAIKYCVMQQLYIYAGILAVNATVNSAPLRVLVRVAKVGAVWQVLGQLPRESSCLIDVFTKGFPICGMRHMLFHWHTMQYIQHAL